MKINLYSDKEKIKEQQKLAFTGYSTVKSEDGFREYEFAYPYDENKEDCYLEIFKLDKDRFNNYFTTGKAYDRNGNDKYKMVPGANRIDLARKFGIGDNDAFGYHYLVVDKNSKFQKTRIDAGSSIDERNINEQQKILNIVTPGTSNTSRGGSMKLVIIDSQKVGDVYNDQNMIVRDERLAQRGINGIKTIANKFGGTLAGLEKAIDNGEYDYYDKIISLPIFTDDDFTGHAYWNKNCMQMASSLGNINNYASLQRKMFAHGLNFVSDGAFVNEGLEGVHFKHIQKWGENSPYFNWFKGTTPFSMGVFVKNKNYISHKIVNSPYTYTQDNQSGIVKIGTNTQFDKTKPTYIQFFDTRLVSQREREDNTSLIKTYSKMSTDNVYDLHTHNDSVMPYAFEINPETYNSNIKGLNDYNRLTPDRIIRLADYQAARILSKFENFAVDGKFESGFETWDANPDIAKLNFVFSNTDTKALKNLPLDERKRQMAKIIRANNQVQDYSITSGQFWTQKTDDILRLFVAQNLKNIDVDNPANVYSQILNKADNKTFPTSLSAKISKNEVENVLTGFYNNKRNLSNEDKKSQILQGLMNTPLDSFEFGDNIVAVLASPLISKRATRPSEIGVSRYELFKSGNATLRPEYKKTYTKMDNIYTNEMSDFANKVLNQVDETLPADRKLFNGDKVTEYGKYVLPILMPEIAKYAVIKSLVPDLTVAIDQYNGEISYDYKTLKNTHLQGLGILNPASPQDEAIMLLSKMQKGMKGLDFSANSEIVESIIRSIKDTNLQSFQLADLIIDKTEAGLDWRIDAAKDVADIEALRNGTTNFDYTWQTVINFWSKFTQSVLKINPNAYMVAEVTDEIDLHNRGLGYQSKKFKNYSDIVTKFLRETGLTSTANYSHYYNDIIKLFTKKFEDGDSWGDNDFKQKYLFHRMVGGAGQDPFLKSSSLNSIMYSYTFIGNHDKARALHCAAMDMEMFFTDLTYKNNYENRLKAYKLIEDKFMDNIEPYEVNNYDFSAISPKAVAMGYALRTSLIKVLEKYKWDGQLNDEQFTRAFEAVSKAVSDLSQGKFRGKRFDADAFGVKPIDVSIKMVLEQAKNKYHLELPAELNAKYENDVFEKTLDPAISKLLGMMKFLVALPGVPTLFDGDDMGATGYDSKTKNIFLQGRQRIHDEWAEVGGDKYKEFIAKHKKEFDEIMGLRKNSKCSALNNGAPFTLPLQDAEDKHNSNNKYKVPVILRQSTDGKMALSIFNTSGLHNNHEEYYSPIHIKMDSIKFNFETQKDENGNEKTVFMDGAEGVGITGLKSGTIFVNAKDENDKYYVNEFDGKYFLKRGTDNGQITVEDSTLVLYHVPDNQVSFSGRYHTPSYNFVADIYSNKETTLGKNLALCK